MPPNLFVVMVEFDNKAKGDPSDKFLKSPLGLEEEEQVEPEPITCSSSKEAACRVENKIGDGDVSVKDKKSWWRRKQEETNGSTPPPPVGNDPVATEEAGHGGGGVEDAPTLEKTTTFLHEDLEHDVENSTSRHHLDSVTFITFEEIQGLLQETLNLAKADRLLMYDPVWTYGNDQTGEHLTITFPCKQDDTDEVLIRLQRIGIGQDVGAVSIIPTSFTKAYQNPNTALGHSSTTERGAASINDDSIEKLKEENVLAEKEKQIVVDACSQIRIEQVVEQVQKGGEMGFDYILLVLIAASLAGTGLATDNTVVIVASMLVSPIMGPIMAFTFGATMRNWKLVQMGLKNELLSLLLCLFVGMVVGCVAHPFDVEDLWPTTEMESRGSWMGLMLGVAIAVPSGMGVALSILGNNTSSLVGVAISASLLPPAVNCGMLLAFAALSSTYDDNVDHEYMIKCGFASFCLTLVNIGCIFVTSVIMFQVKEVAPLENKSAFWVDLKRQKQKRRETRKRGKGKGGDEEEDATLRVAGAGAQDLAAELRKALRLRHSGLALALERQNGISTIGLDDSKQQRTKAIQHLVRRETLKADQLFPQQNLLSLHPLPPPAFGAAPGLRGLFGDVALGYDDQAEALDGVGNLFAEEEEEDNSKLLGLFRGLFIGSKQQ